MDFKRNYVVVNIGRSGENVSISLEPEVMGDVMVGNINQVVSHEDSLNFYVGQVWEFNLTPVTATPVVTSNSGSVAKLGNA